MAGVVLTAALVTPGYIADAEWFGEMVKITLDCGCVYVIAMPAYHEQPADLIDRPWLCGRVHGAKA